MSLKSVFDDWTGAIGTGERGSGEASQQQWQCQQRAHNELFLEWSVGTAVAAVMLVTTRAHPLQ